MLTLVQIHPGILCKEDEADLCDKILTLQMLGRITLLGTLVLVELQNQACKTLQLLKISDLRTFQFLK